MIFHGRNSLHRIQNQTTYYIVKSLKSGLSLAIKGHNSKNGSIKEPFTSY